ncbi:MAG TPA: flagellar hook-length control protein FliK [Pyrinomonadaceae bacterium]|nr:flagellar hook-length control protein FliK [Pyrinomonadaceae bacterium]
MINANFTKQDTPASQAPSADDALEKDGRDDFNALMSGLCMTPADGTKPDPTKKPAETGGTGDGEARMADQRANLGSVKFNDPKNPAFGQLPEPPDAAALTPNPQNAAQIQAGALPAAQVKPEVKSELAQKLDRLKNFKFMAPDGETKMAPQPIKPLVKDIKTQANKFEETPDTTASIKVAKNFAAMTQDKTAVVKALADLGAHVHLEDPTVLGGDTSVEEGDTHLDNNYILERGCLLPDGSIKATDLLRAQRKLPKLISDVTGIAADETTSVSNGEIAQAEASALPKASTAAAAMLEQIKPAVIQLAAATANEGKQILRMRLHPAELGTVEIRLEKNAAGVLEAHFKTDTEGAKHFLTQGLDALRNSLQNAGWQVGRVEISTGAFSSTTDGGDGLGQKDARQRDETSPGQEAKNFGPASTRSGDQADISADRLVNLRA